MAGPTAQPIIISSLQRIALEQIIRRHTSPQMLVRRAHIIVAAGTDVQNEPIARRLQCTRKTVRTWRARWAAAQSALAAAETDLDADALLAQVEAVLADAPRSGAPDTFSAEQIVAILALACTPPAQSARPVSAWTPRELADEAVKQEIVRSISPRSVERFFKAGRAETASKPLLVEHERT